MVQALHHQLAFLTPAILASPCLSQKMIFNKMAEAQASIPLMEMRQLK